jgi:Leucine-rich repeat (LRR) protein
MEIPDFIGNLVGLAYLDISHNQFKELPDFIAGLKNLTHLNIGYSGKRGTELDSPGLDKVPDFVGSMTNLTHLDISHIGSFKPTACITATQIGEDY